MAHPAYASYPVPGASVIPLNNSVMPAGYAIPAVTTMPVYTPGHQPANPVVPAPPPALSPEV